MRGLIIFVLCVTAVYCAKLPVAPKYKPLVQKPVDIAQQVPVVSTEQQEQQEQHQQQQQVQEPVAIISQDSEVNPDGSYHNVWEAENGIKVSEEGTVKVVKENEILSVNGKISYTDADGHPIVLTYIADENGFQPQGDHLPTAPPVPLPIARALEYIAEHPYVEDENVKTPTKEYMKVIPGKDLLIPVVEDA